MKILLWHYLIGFILLLIGGCSSVSVEYDRPIKDNARQMWTIQNDRVEKFRHHYRTAKHMSVGMERSKSYVPEIREILKKYNLPPQLAYLPLLESGFRPDARSPSGARGLWQFTEATAKDYGLRVGWLRDDRLNWKKSTEAAVKYLKKLGERFNYDWQLALAAYNGGPKYIEDSMKAQGSNNFWHLKLRKETAEYVPRFIAILQIANEKYPNLFQEGVEYNLALNQPDDYGELSSNNSF